MSSRLGAKTVFAFALGALIAIAISAAVHFRDQDEDSLRDEAVSADDASVDGRATVATKKPTKKKAVRGGKTRVAGRGGGGGGARGGSGGRGSASGPAQEPDDRGGGAAAPAGRARGGRAGPSGPSYESALDSNDHQLTIGANTGPDLTDAQLSAPMSDGNFVGECGAPDDMNVTVKVAIKMGRAVGVSVWTNPAAPDVAGCIDRHVRGLSWPSSPKMDSFVTTY